MQSQLISVTTQDKIDLGGALFSLDRQSTGDVVLFFHGDGGNFYAPLYSKLASYLAERGMPCVSANRRGHDLVAHGAKGARLAGYAFESVADFATDCEAWISALRRRGYERVFIAGHSGGAVRVVYAQAQCHFPEVPAVVSISPGEYAHRRVVECHGGDFSMPYREACHQVELGHRDELFVPGVPWGSMWSYGAYVDCFNQDDRYSVTAHAQNTACPTLFVFGALECEGSQKLPVCSLACEMLSEKAYAHVDITVVEEANHRYESVESRLYECVADWLIGRR